MLDTGMTFDEIDRQERRFEVARRALTGGDDEARAAEVRARIERILGVAVPPSATDRH